MFVERTDTAAIKLTDFGLAAMYTESEYLSEVLGSAYYVAPEVLR
jgi:calcium-dependent protein kinase